MAVANLLRSWHRQSRETRVAVIALAGWSSLWIAAYATQAGTSWFYFERGSRWLFDPDGAVGGLDLYVGHPEIQIGPLSLLVSAPFVAPDGFVGRWSAIAMCAGAVDCKPWAIGFAGLLVALPGRHRLGALAVLVAGTTVAWAPFVVHDWATVSAVHYGIPNSPFSALRALGVDTPRTPAWCRAAQFSVGLALAACLAARGHPALVPLAVVTSRLLLDPGAHLYYNAGLVGAAALADVSSLRRRPWWTAGAMVGVVVPITVAGGGTLALAGPVGLLRAVSLAVGIAACVLLCARRRAAS